MKTYTDIPGTKLTVEVDEYEDNRARVKLFTSDECVLNICRMGSFSALNAAAASLCRMVEHLEDMARDVAEKGE